MSNSQLKTLSSFLNIRSLLDIGPIIKAAANTGIVDALLDGQKTTAEIAQAANLNEKAVELVCESLIHTGLLEKYEPYFALSPAAQMLTQNSLQDEHWNHLEEFVRNGVSLPCRDDLDHDESPMIVQLAQDEWMRTPAAMDAVVALDFGKTRRGMRVLEMGCGSGIVSATLAHRDPDSTFVLADQSENLERARKTVKSINVDSQFEFVEIDSLSPPTESGGFDLVIVVGQLHLRSSEYCANWLKEIRKIMHFDGELAIVDLFPGQEAGQKNLALYELQLSLRSQAGELHSAPQMKEMLVQAGFGQVQFAHLPSPPHYWGLLVAEYSDQPL